MGVLDLSPASLVALGLSLPGLGTQALVVGGSLFSSLTPLEKFLRLFPDPAGSRAFRQ
jgi:hypothetical protein